MDEIDCLEHRIDSLKDRVRNFEITDNGLLLVLMLFFAAYLYIYNHGIVETLKDLGEFLLGIGGILFVIGILYSIAMLKKNINHI